MNRKKEINLNTVIIRNQEIDATDLNGDKVMMNLDKGKYYALSEVGGRIWDIIDEPVQIRKVIDVLMKEYDIDELNCKKEVISFLERMQDAELIKII